MSFGATKNGAMMLEAVIFFDLSLAEDFAYRRMRGGQLLSKSRYLGAQMLAYLDGGLWLDNARRANALAQKLGDGLRQIAGDPHSQPGAGQRGVRRDAARALRPAAGLGRHIL